MKIIKQKSIPKGRVIPLQINTHPRKKLLTLDEKSYIFKEEIKDEPIKDKSKESRIANTTKSDKMSDEKSNSRPINKNDDRSSRNKRTRKLKNKLELEIK